MFKARFSTPLRYLQTRNETIAPENPSKRQRIAWVIARSLCHYRLFASQDIPLQHRDEALAHQVRQWSPFPHYASYIVWQGDVAQVWIWDKARQQAAVAACDLDKVAVTMPEAVLRVPPAVAAAPQARLIDTVEGVEGQIWRAGHLLASRWWSTAPDLAAWQHFCRAYAVPLLDTVPTCETLALLPQPWGKPRRQFGLAMLQQERLWVWVVGSVFSVLLIWEGLSLWRWHSALQDVQTEIEALNDLSTPLLTARNRAITDKRIAEQLLQLHALPSQIELLAAVTSVLPNNAKLVGWIYQGDSLQVTVEASYIDPRFYVKKFQSLPHFAEVRTETTAQVNQILINALIVP